MVKLVSADRRISVQRIGAGRYIAYLPGNKAHEGGRLRLVGADNTTYVRQVVRAIEQAVAGERGRPGHAGRFVVRRRRGRRDRGGRHLAGLRGRPGRHRRRPGGAGALDPRADTSAVAGGPGRPGRPPRLADQRQRRQPRHRRLRRRRPVGPPGRTSQAAGRPTRPSTPACAPRSAGSRSSATSPAESLRSISVGGMALISSSDEPSLPWISRRRTPRAASGCGTPPSARPRRRPAPRCRPSPSAGRARG